MAERQSKARLIQRVASAADSRPRQSVSVIIPVHNSEAELRQCLAAVFEQRSEWLECIVVDDGSSDGSAAVSRAYPVTLKHLPRRCGPAFARNVGALAARGDIIFFLDADCRLRPGALSRVRRLLSNSPEIAAVFGSYDARPPGRSLVSRYKNLTHHWVHQNASRAATTFWGACGAVRREVFLKLGGFDSRCYPDASIEDVELGYRLYAGGYQVRLDPELQVTHLKRWRLMSLLRSEVFARGVPWSRLLWHHRRLPNDLNFRWGHRASAMAACLLPVAMVLGIASPWFLGLAAALLGIFLALNARYLRFMRRTGGLTLALLALPMQVIFYWCAALALVLGTAAHFSSRQRERDAARAEAPFEDAYEVLNGSPLASERHS